MAKRGVGVVVLAAMLTSMLWMAAPAAANGCDARHVTGAGRTWKVTPTGGDDSANIQCAIDAAAEVAGSTVELSAGHFRAALLTITDMHGTFRGAGEETTTLEALPDLECYTERMDVGKSRTWIYVEQGDVTVRDITLEVTDPTPCAITEEGQGTDLFGGILQFGGRGVLDGFDCDNPPVYEVNGRVQDVTFLAPTIIPDVDVAAFHGVWVSGSGSFHCEEVFFWAPVTGEVSVVRSTFVNMALAVAAAGLTDGKITFGGSARNGNTVEGPLGFVGADLDGSEAIVTHNQLTVTEWGTLFIQGDTYNGFGHAYPDPGTVTVRANTIIGTETTDGVGLIDVVSFLGAGSRLDAVVTRNTIDLDSEFGGIFGFGAQGATVRANVITGTGLAGVYHGVNGDSSGGWRITGNDLTGFDGAVADYWLGASSFGDQVVTNDPTDTVLDEGTDNTVVGPARLQAAAALATAMMKSTVTDYRSRWDH